MGRGEPSVQGPVTPASAQIEYEWRGDMGEEGRGVGGRGEGGRRGR